MSFSKKLGFAVLAMGVSLALGARGGDGQEHQHGAGPLEKLGHVHFGVSCSTAAQIEFDRANAMLHSFWYEEAEKAFDAVTTTDPACAMGHWGVAMANFHPLWEPPSAAVLQKGAAAVEKAKAANPRTDRERDYVSAVEVFYKDSDKLDHRARALVYEKAMEKVYLRYPEDREAGVYYALALLGTAAPTDKTYANQKKAAAILDKVFAVEPDHPGVTHYFIHAYDSPELAHLALAAARRYAKIAPGVPHALHMPSHIFTRLGLWQESIQSNRAAEAAAKDYAMKMQLGGAWDQELHAKDYLVYAYLQGGQDRQAQGVLDNLQAMRKVQPENLTSAFAFAAIPARYALERHRWAEAAALEPAPAWFPWSRYPVAPAMIYFARALGAARSGHPGDAQKDVEKLEALHKSLVEAHQAYWADSVEILRREAAAWAAQAGGKPAEGLQLMRSAAELEDSTDKHPVTPGSLLPARELLGDLLLEQRHAAEAVREYETALAAAPNRFNALYGAARAAELSGNREKARAYYARLVEVSKLADDDRPDLKEARTHLAKN
jgi:tetratricopeptide (TPR) repeat protein